eukprot:2896508-Prymnesium_polylepis.1
MKLTYGVDAGIAGIFFMIPGVVYILTAMVAGATVDSFGGATAPRQEYKLKLMATVGFVLLYVGYLFLAPVFQRAALERIAVLAASLVAIGVGIGLTIMPSNTDLTSIAERRMQPSGDAEEEALTSQIAGLWSSSYYLGMVIGPIIGGTLESSIGINWGSFTFAVACACGALLNAWGAWQARAPGAAYVAVEPLD